MDCFSGTLYLTSSAFGDCPLRVRSRSTDKKILREDEIRILVNLQKGSLVSLDKDMEVIWCGLKNTSIASSTSL
jgi:hypothetical protein